MTWLKKDYEPVECTRCKGSGEIAINATTGHFVCAGPVPDDSSHASSTCWDCRGTGYVEGNKP